MDKKVVIETLKTKIRKTENRGNYNSGCIKKWERQIRNLSK